MKQLCIYDLKDLDGHCSAAIVRRFFPDCELFPFNYGMEIPWDKIDGETVVVMVDISAPMDDMERIYQQSKNFVWIDHHKSAIQEYNDRGLVFEGAQEIGLAACELTWGYFFAGENLPPAVSLLGRYDVWEHDGEDVLPFQYGARLEIEGPESDVWIDLLDNYQKPGHSVGHDFRLSDLVNKGRTILRYQESNDAIYARARAFETEIHGHKALVCNVALVNSRFFDSIVDPSRHEVLSMFCLTPRGNWKVSLRSVPGSGVDVSEIAKRRGGGGHKDAASFLSPTCPFHPLDFPAQG